MDKPTNISQFALLRRDYVPKDGKVLDVYNLAHNMKFILVSLNDIATGFETYYIIVNCFNIPIRVFQYALCMSSTAQVAVKFKKAQESIIGNFMAMCHAEFVSRQPIMTMYMMIGNMLMNTMQMDVVNTWESRQIMKMDDMMQPPDDYYGSISFAQDYEDEFIEPLNSPTPTYHDDDNLDDTQRIIRLDDSIVDFMGSIGELLDDREDDNDDSGDAREPT